MIVSVDLFWVKPWAFDERIVIKTKTKGLRPFDSIGEVFDVEKHEAITEIPAPSEDMKGKVIDQVEKGYFLYEKIIRYAKVVVGK